MNKKTFFLLLMGLVLLPTTALAFDFSDGGAPFAPQGNAFVVTTIVNNILNNILSFIWVIFIGFAVIMFIWAGILFLSAQGEIEVLKQAKRALLWGIIGVVVGILAFSLPWIIYGGIYGSQSQNNGGGWGNNNGGGNNIVTGACTVNGVCSQMSQADCLDPTMGTWRPGACPAACRPAGSICTRPGSNECCQGSTCIADSGQFNRFHCVGVNQ